MGEADARTRGDILKGVVGTSGHGFCPRGPRRPGLIRRAALVSRGASATGVL
jgi:hypothetical protein